MRLLRPGISYFGIDIAIHDPAPNLLETDILDAPIGFAGRRFDIVTALGVFEYVGARQTEKFGEIAALLSERGRCVVTSTTRPPRAGRFLGPYSRAPRCGESRRTLPRHFTIDRF